MTYQSLLILLGLKDLIIDSYLMNLIFYLSLKKKKKKNESYHLYEDQEKRILCCSIDDLQIWEENKSVEIFKIFMPKNISL